MGAKQSSEMEKGQTTNEFQLISEFKNFMKKIYNFAANLSNK